LKHHEDNQTYDARSKRHRSDRTIDGITHMGVAEWFGRKARQAESTKRAPGVKRIVLGNDTHMLNSHYLHIITWLFQCLQFVFVFKRCMFNRNGIIPGETGIAVAQV